MDGGVNTMTKIIAIISGKGGVGKTTSAINLGAALSDLGKDVTVVDANLTTPNVGLHLGVPVVPVSLHDILKSEKHITESVYLHPSGLKIIPASIALKDIEDVNLRRLKEKIAGLRGVGDIIIIDSAAGLGKEAVAAIESADEVIIVTNPELPAVTDALRSIKLVEKKVKKYLVL